MPTDLLSSGKIFSRCIKTEYKILIMTSTENYQSLFLRRIRIPAIAINSAKSSNRPTTKIIIQKIFPKLDKFLKFSASHNPGKFPTVDRQATDIDTASEKVGPV